MRTYTKLEARREITRLMNEVIEWKEAYVNQVGENEHLEKRIKELEEQCLRETLRRNLSQR